jgi:OOP family OmpA-OmpF porin
MRIDYKNILIGLLLGFVLAGCAGNKLEAMPTEKGETKVYHTQGFDSCQEITIPVGWTQKVQNFSLIFDPSASMTEQYVPYKACEECYEKYAEASHPNGDASKSVKANCEECRSDFTLEKFDFAKRLTRCLNQSFPQIEMKSVLRTFGSSVYSSKTHKTPRVYDRSKYDRQINGVLEAEGSSPLAWAFKSTVKDWFRSEGKISVIVVSDGKGMGDPAILAAQDLKEVHGDDVCIYTIHVGDDRPGYRVMEEIAEAGVCGASISGDELLIKSKREEFVRNIFFKERLDSDKDGVWDENDECPGTAEGLPVNEKGCWKAIVMSDVLFDSGESTIKPKGGAVLQKVVDYLATRPVLRVRIDGHTDNVGGVEYNTVLSKQRAEAGKAYLVGKGVSEERIMVGWHSFSRPVASNNTTQGRAQNRRIEFTFTK